MKEPDVDKQFLQAMRRCTTEMPKTLTEKVELQHTAVLVIDMQNDFCHNDGVWVQRGIDVSSAQELAPRLSKFLAEARRYQALVIFVRTSYAEWSISPVSMQQQMRFPEHLRCFPREGTWGAEFYQVAPREGDCVVTKYRYSAFQGTNLELILGDKAISTLIVTGIATPVCVGCTARDGYMREFFIVVPRDCVASRSVEEQDVELSLMDRFLGTVVTSEDIITAWQKSRGV